MKRAFIYDGKEITSIPPQKFEDIYLGRLASQKHANKIAWMIPPAINGKREIKPVLVSHRGYVRWDLLLDTLNTPLSHLINREFVPSSENEKRWLEAVKQPLDYGYVANLIREFDFSRQSRRVPA